MRTSDVGRYALAICVAVAVLAGCGGGAQPQLAPSGSFQQSTAQSLLGQLPEGRQLRLRAAPRRPAW